MENHEDITISVPFQGEQIECRTLQDAEAIKTANDVLSNYDAPSYPAADLELLAGVLIRCGHSAAAERLKSRMQLAYAADLASRGLPYEV